MRASVIAALVVFASCGGPAPGLSFRKRLIDPAFRSEGVTVFDVNEDGHPDLVTEELWYEGPGFVPHEVRAPRSWDPLTAYAHCFGAFHLDVDRDGYDDLIVFGPPGEEASWCRNPRGGTEHWACHPIAASASGESPLLDELFRGEGPALVMGIEPEKVLGTMKPSIDGPWTMQPLTPSGFPQAARYEHGLGLGDVDGDGLTDILTGSGWLEQPVDRALTPWPWHPVALCPNNCAHMFAFDLNGDGLTDIIGTSPHAHGAWWFERRPGGSFVTHEIDRTISQMHAARFVDLDGDAVPELVTGKRWYAHFTQDPGALEPAMLVVYRMRREGTTVEWTRLDIDSDSGVGSQFEVADVNGDGKLDIVTSNKKGLYVFEQQ